MTPLASAVSGALLHFLWQGAVVAFLLSLVMLPMRSVRARYAAACGALLLMAVLPVATAWVLYREPAVGGVALAGAPPGLARWAGFEAWVLPLWSVGVLVCSVRLLRGLRETVVLRRRGEAAGGAVLAAVERIARRMGHARPVRVLLSTLAEVPSEAGFWRPVILVPVAAVAGLSPEHLEAILAHEVAHLRRCDQWVNLAQAAVETLLFYHPAVWWVSARIREERELCCDDLAVAAVGDAACYARALTSLERLRAPALAVAANGGSLLYRVQRLAGVAPGRARSAVPAAVALVTVALCVALSAGFVRAEPFPMPPQAPAPQGPVAAEEPRPAKATPEAQAPQPTEETVAQPAPAVASADEVLAAVEEALYAAAFEDGYLTAAFGDTLDPETARTVGLNRVRVQEMKKARDRLSRTSDLDFRRELLTYLAEQSEVLRTSAEEIRAQYGPRRPPERRR